MTKGKLSQNDKYLIQGALHNKKTPKEIAKLIDRSENCVNHYIDGELNKIHETITKIELEKNPPKVKEPPKGQAKLAMAMKTAGDKQGVAIMTPGASAIGDDFIKTIPKTIARTVRGNIYTADTGKKIE